MKNFSARNKIIVLSLVWLGLSASMFLYFFNILDSSNSATVLAMAKQQQELLFLQAQDQSYQQAKLDLRKLAQESIQPGDFFSQDITLVKEIETLESLGQKLNLQMQISGVGGTVKSAPKAKTITSLATIPYSISLNGDFASAVGFIETLEHLSFISN